MWLRVRGSCGGCGIAILHTDDYNRLQYVVSAISPSLLLPTSTTIIHHDSPVVHRPSSMPLSSVLTSNLVMPKKTKKSAIRLDHNSADSN